MKAVYFAWVRERVGKSEETLAPPPGVSGAGAIGGLGLSNDFTADQGPDTLWPAWAT